MVPCKWAACATTCMLDRLHAKLQQQLGQSDTAANVNAAQRGQQPLLVHCCLHGLSGLWQAA